MKKSFIVFTVMLLGTWILLSCSAYSKTLPAYPRGHSFGETQQMTGDLGQDTARRLFELVHRENRGLRWNECLSQKAYERAKYLVKNKRFSHKDPRTGKNPAWDMLKSCCNFRYAGENLVRGDLPAESLHEALMESPSHRKNIMDPNFDLLGIGCYGDICVQLFAGF
ncbi:CAP domain-containing protein [Desulforhabdus amnigena]|jgi:hypothetical protein|uniref:SCP domain-containing protein n=1 Tax=Desulforhabdus amnigena TaxID=40218 RepID=A0A9W6FUM8_9BACT|nr:CAP domain-containing protein [Desulforhabdus amnigena]NLJ29498.1 hypothetical protein [Deltaproteobacteria bacterium]GLI35182.1 hypothetical protein DAMNIGENAA_26150 [Desulforhabdus amnigena]